MDRTFAVVAAVAVVGLFHAAVALAAGAERWGRFELTLKSAAKHANPFADVQLDCTFTRGGRSITAGGFHDGEQTWKVRFMPPEEGPWTYRTRSNDPALDGQTGTLEVGPPGKDNHGPIGVRNTYHFAYADGRPYFPVGTTLYNWVHREEALQQRTLATLGKHAFNKVRFCVFPKWYEYNRVEPPLYPWPKQGEGFDRDRFDPDYFRHIERRLDDLLKLGILADLILFHPYDHWGHSRMSPAQDDAYLKYAIARLASWRNVWWTMANEYDLFKPPKDWDHIFQVVQRLDPYDHPRSNHNCRGWYDHSRPWVTHCNIQAGGGDLYKLAVDARQKYRKPVVIDEYGYEGDIKQGWGNRSAAEETHRHWSATIGGAYASHGETYLNERQELWWAVGGELIGQSPARLAFLRQVMEAAPYEELVPDPRLSGGNCVLCRPGRYYLIYFPARAEAKFRLPGRGPYQLDGIDTWEMKVSPLGTAQGGEFTFTPPKEKYLLRITAKP